MRQKSKRLTIPAVMPRRMTMPQRTLTARLRYQTRVTDENGIRCCPPVSIIPMAASPKMAPRTTVQTVIRTIQTSEGLTP